ncbi:hypothetical protein D4T97_005220 [Siminovitchia acidinfaciens]|uniref:Uncharacterized protein n=1 Tax=Siminovitchia acidinfaciens TaxID=2321395 RepID=A0A429Y438_9BACI|nr:hypothetical protein [Siminovitchia acidinfaciens]RST76185.1 hypothetical protein D4T97_005220 [Siminovitchia acidinfaciens]
MDDLTKELRQYRMMIGNLELSPFETLQDLYIRNTLEDKISLMTHKERLRLHYYDLQVILNADKFKEQLENVYDFSTNKPLKEWWWHLDKVASGELMITLDMRVENNLIGKLFNDSLNEIYGKTLEEIQREAYEKPIKVKKKERTRGVNSFFSVFFI